VALVYISDPAAYGNPLGLGYLEKTLAKVATWDPAPPYLLISMKGLGSGYFTCCSKVVRKIADVTRRIYGRSMLMSTQESFGFWVSHMQHKRN